MNWHRMVMMANRFRRFFYETAPTVHPRPRPFASSSGSQHDSHKQECMVGRLSAAAAIGTVLRIKPVLQIQGEKLDAYAKVKTLKAAKSTMIKAIRHDFEERFHDPDGDNFYMHVAYTADDTEAQAFRKELETEFPGHRVDFVDPLSLSVSCHIGPGALAVAISKKVPELG